MIKLRLEEMYLVKILHLFQINLFVLVCGNWSQGNEHCPNLNLPNQLNSILVNLNMKY